ncbi:alpha/beta hydrolase [Actinokineospora sp. HUAS TT18]|uniref:alpha/beta hydrolase n=1 Tax=Actinokineospora sp. HUAS TT18 TaxID=3447451 RepID=UPI003F520053
MAERIEFTAGDVPLVGTLRVADNAVGAVALSGPFTGVKEQVVGTYAERLTEAGFTTLAIDHRGFGESGGRRGHEDTQGKLADLRAAVDVLAGHTDQIGLVGVCLGGGYVMRAAATDPRVKAVAGIAGAYNSPAFFAQGMGIDNYRGALASFLAGYDDLIPAVAPDNGEAAMAGDEPYSYYGTERSTAEHWRNEVTRGSLHSLMTFDALGAADLLGATPLLVVHGKVDAYCSPELASQLHARAAGEKEIVWLDATEHVDLYDIEPYVTQAVDVTTAFLAKHLVTQG